MAAGSEPPAGYTGGSMLPQPAVDVSMKVFAGGGSSSPPDGYVSGSILPQPDYRVPLEMFKGGGSEPEVQEGGARGYFRNLSLAQVHDDPLLSENVLILRVLNPAVLRDADEDIRTALLTANVENGIQVLPVFVGLAGADGLARLQYMGTNELLAAPAEMMILGAKRTDLGPRNLDELTRDIAADEESSDILVVWSTLMFPEEPLLDPIDVREYAWERLQVPGAARAAPAPAPAPAPAVPSRTAVAATPKATQKPSQKPSQKPDPPLTATASPKAKPALTLRELAETPELPSRPVAKTGQTKYTAGSLTYNNLARAFSVLDLTKKPKGRGQRGGAYEDAPTQKLACGLRVRLIQPNSDVKEDILNLNFTPSEQVLFERVLGFNEPFILAYIQDDANKEEFFNFWKAFVNYDGTDGFTLMTAKEGKNIQRFLRNLQTSYLEYLLNQPYASPKEEKGPSYGAKELLRNILSRGKKEEAPVAAPVAQAAAPVAPAAQAAEPPVGEEGELDEEQNDNSTYTNTGSNSYTLSGDEEETASTQNSYNTSTSLFDLERLIDILKSAKEDYEDRTINAIQFINSFFEGYPVKVKALREMFSVAPNADIFGKLINEKKIYPATLFKSIERRENTSTISFPFIFKNIFLFDISTFSEEGKETFTKFFLQFIPKSKYKNIRDFINIRIERSKRGLVRGGGSRSTKRARKSSSRSRVRTSRKAHSK